jgi:hypothetical protein
MADNLTTFKCRLSRNLVASTSWNPVALSRPVKGLLYLYLYPPVTVSKDLIIVDIKLFGNPKFVYSYSPLFRLLVAINA